MSPMSPDDIPHIRAQCAQCGYIYGLHVSLDCPICRSVAVKWATLEPEPLPQPSLSPQDIREIEWLEEHVTNAPEPTKEKP